MSEKISNILLEIEAKISALKNKLQAEIVRNEQFVAEISTLETKNEELANNVSALMNEINTLKEENILLESKINDTSAPNEVNKDVEIDFLVREIDQCISQIKNSL